MPVSFEETKDEPNVNEDANDKADGLNDFENGIIQEEYKIWKKNSPFLYDFVMTYSLDWPSLTIQWLPDKSVTSSTTAHKLILGTQSDGTDQNYLMIADVSVLSFYLCY
jgi:histone-binding protein RBBP4